MSAVPLLSLTNPCLPSSLPSVSLCLYFYFFPSFPPFLPTFLSSTLPLPLSSLPWFSLPHSIDSSPLCTPPCSVSQLFPPPPSHLCLFTLPLFVSLSPLLSLFLYMSLSLRCCLSPLSVSSLFSLSHGCQRHFCDLQLVFSLQLHSHKSDHWQVWPLHGWDMRTCGPGTTLKGAGRAGAGVIQGRDKCYQREWGGSLDSWGLMEPGGGWDRKPTGGLALFRC